MYVECNQWFLCMIRALPYFPYADTYLKFNLPRPFRIPSLHYVSPFPLIPKSPAATAWTMISAIFIHYVKWCCKINKITGNQAKNYEYQTSWSELWKGEPDAVMQTISRSWFKHEANGCRKPSCVSLGTQYTQKVHFKRNFSELGVV